MFYLGLGVILHYSDNYVSKFLLGLDFLVQLNLLYQRREVWANPRVSNHVVGRVTMWNIHNIGLHCGFWHSFNVSNCLKNGGGVLAKYFLTISLISLRGIFKWQGGGVLG